MRKPNFFIAGAPRSGTTSLYTYLKQHPQIYVSVDKEPHFFGSDLTAQPGTIREEDLYLQLFAGASDLPRVGEASVWYLASRRAPFEIRAFAPDARIVILLREPARMAHSLYSLYRRTGNEDLPTFEEALAAEPERRRGRRIPAGAYFPAGLLYTDAARYAEKVERYFAAFGRDAVHCILFDDFVRDTVAVYRQTLEFLEVDPGFQAELDPRRASQRVRMQVIRQLRQLPPALLGRIQFRQMKLHDAASPHVSLAAAASLRQVFAADVARLGELLGRDLGAWTRGEEVAARLAAARGEVPPALAATALAAAPGKPPRAAPGKVPPAVGGNPPGAARRDALAGVRALRAFPADLRTKHDRVETLERKFARWQRLRVPELSLEQRPANPEWPAWFLAERARIALALAPRALRIEHFGSTAVPGLPAKNVIDVALGLDAPPSPEIAAALAGIGYESYGNSPVDPETLWFWKRESDRAFVLHTCDDRRPWIGEQVDMRDYLRAHTAERDRYGELKRRLAEDKELGLLHYSLRKLAITVELVDRARAWRSATVAAQS